MERCTISWRSNYANILEGSVMCRIEANRKLFTSLNTRVRKLNVLYIQRRTTFITKAPLFFVRSYNLMEIRSTANQRIDRT